MSREKQLYGIWNGMTKRFVFGIKEESAKKSFQVFSKEFGDLARCWRYVVKVIPEGWVNPKNPIQRKRGKR